MRRSVYCSSAAGCSACVGGLTAAHDDTPLFRTQQDRDGCPKIVNLGTSKTDLFYERKKYGFKRCVALLVVSINWWVGVLLGSGSV